MKALEKDRNRRYDTANSFAMDVQRYLVDEPVLACPPSVRYRLRKFVRRNRGPLVTTALLVAMLLAALGGVSASLGWAQGERAAEKAHLEQESLQALDETRYWCRHNNLLKAFAELKRAEGFQTGGKLEGELGQRVARWRLDLEMAARVEAIRF